MARKPRLNAEEAFKGLMGKSAGAEQNAVIMSAAGKADPDPLPEEIKNKSTAISEPNKEKLIQTGFYITKTS